MLQEKAYITQAMGKIGMISRQNPTPQTHPVFVEGNDVVAGRFVFAGTQGNQVVGTALAGTTPNGVAVFENLQLALNHLNGTELNEGEVIAELLTGCCYIPNDGITPSFGDHVLIDPTTGAINCSASTSQVATAGTLSFPEADETYTDYNVITNGSATLNIDGTEGTVTGLDFSLAGSMNDVATVITTALSGTGICTYTLGEGLTITSATTGDTSSVIFVSASADLAGLLGANVSIQGTNAMNDTGWTVLTVNSELEAIEIQKL